MDLDYYLPYKKTKSFKCIMSMNRDIEKHIKSLNKAIAHQRVIIFKDVAGKVHAHKEGKKSFISPTLVKGSTSIAYGIPVNKAAKEEQEKKYGVAASIDDTFELYDGASLDLTNPEHQKIWGWLQYSPIIAASFDDAMGVVDAQYYIYQPEKNAEKVVSNTELRIEALTYVQGLTIAEQRNIVRILNHQTADKTDYALKEILYTVADKEPNVILRLRDDETLESQLLYYKALDCGIIRVNELDGTVIINYTETQGATMPSTQTAIGWINDPKNLLKVDLLRTRVLHESNNIDDVNVSDLIHQNTQDIEEEEEVLELSFEDIDDTIIAPPRQGAVKSPRGSKAKLAQLQKEAKDEVNRTKI